MIFPIVYSFIFTISPLLLVFCSSFLLEILRLRVNIENNNVIDVETDKVIKPSSLTYFQTLLFNIVVISPWYLLLTIPVGLFFTVTFSILHFQN